MPRRYQVVTYQNGYVPDSALILFNQGTNGDGYWAHLLPPRTYRKHLALVARAKARTGRTLAPGAGYSCYRPYSAQVRYQQIYGLGAATPGKSSHGGNWAGPVTGWKLVDTVAIDYSNWASVYGNGDGRDTPDKRDAFFADQKAVGLTPHGIASPYFPDEPWHSIDTDSPYAELPAPADNGSTPFPTEVDMPLTAADVALIWGYRGTGTTDAWQLVHDAIAAASKQGITPAQIWAYANNGTVDAWQKLSDASAPTATAPATISDADLDRIATKVADIISKRMAS